MARIAGDANARAVPYVATSAKIGQVAVRLGGRVQSDRGRSDQLAGHRQAGDAAPIEAVGHRPGHGHEDERGDELGQAEEAEVEVPAGQVEQELAQSRELGDRRHRREEAREQQRDDRPIGEESSS